MTLGKPAGSRTFVENGLIKAGIWCLRIQRPAKGLYRAQFSKVLEGEISQSPEWNSKVPSCFATAQTQTVEFAKTPCPSMKSHAC